MKMNYSDTINIGFGAMLGVGASLVTQFVTQKTQNKALANSFKGKISALISIIDKRNYLSQLEEIIKHIKSTNKPEPYYFHVSQDTLVLKQLQYDKLISSEHIRNLIEYYQEYYSVFKITYDLGEEIIKLIDEKYN